MSCFLCTLVIDNKNKQMYSFFFKDIVQYYNRILVNVNGSIEMEENGIETILWNESKR